jgi:dTMP kinase
LYYPCFFGKIIINEKALLLLVFLVVGKLIVIEGNDGSGKATQSKLLIEKLEEKGVKTEYFDFPRYDNPCSSLVKNYLNGKYGSVDEVLAKVSSMFYAVDRYDASFEMKKALEENKIIICNRYVSSSMGHQASKIKDKKEREEFLEWLQDLEYNFFNIPKPDLTIFLHVDFLNNQKLIDNKGHRDYLGGEKRDIHEDIKYIKSGGETYLELINKMNWIKIDCVKNNNLLSIEEINIKIMGVVNNFLGV